MYGKGYFTHLGKDKFEVSNEGVGNDIKKIQVKLLKSEMQKAIRDSGLPLSSTGKKEEIIKNFIRLINAKRVPLKIKTKTPKFNYAEDSKRFKSKDPYVILGVTRDSTMQEIEKQFRKLSLKYHPDKYKNDNDFQLQLNMAIAKIKGGDEEDEEEDEDKGYEDIDFKNFYLDFDFAVLYDNVTKKDYIAYLKEENKTRVDSQFKKDYNKAWETFQFYLPFVEMLNEVELSENQELMTENIFFMMLLVSNVDLPIMVKDDDEIENYMELLKIVKKFSERVNEPAIYKIMNDYIKKNGFYKSSP